MLSLDSAFNIKRLAPAHPWPMACLLCGAVGSAIVQSKIITLVAYYGTLAHTAHACTRKGATRGRLSTIVALPLGAQQS